MEATSVRAAAGTGLLAAVVSTASFGATVGAMSAFARDSAADADRQVVSALEGADRLALGAIATSSTVQVRAEACGRTTRGSGVLVGGSVWTAAHVVEGADVIRVARAEFEVGATSELVLEGRDLAVLELDAPAASEVTAELRVSALEPGEFVVMVGHPWGGAAEMVTTTVHHVDLGLPWGFDGDVILLDGETAPGTSGGPVFDAAGRLVGLIHGYEATTGLTIVAPVGATMVASDSIEEAAQHQLDGGTTC